MIIDTDNKTLFVDWKTTKFSSKRYVIITSWEGTVIKYKLYEESEGINVPHMYFDYGSENFTVRWLGSKRSSSECTKAEPKKLEVAKKPKFASKEKQYEHTCGKALGLRKGSKRFLECSLKIMEMELELTKLQAEKEVALAQVEAAMANQQMEKVAELNAMANAKSQKFKNNVGNLLLGLLVLGEINSASQQANSFKKVFTCSSTGFATGTQYAVNCY
jgi:hypothetical protein